MRLLGDSNSCKVKFFCQKYFNMNAEQHNRLLEKCFEIYARKRSLLPVYQFLERLESRDGFEANLSTKFWEESLTPEIKNRFFADETIDSLLEKMLVLYRSISDSSDALTRIWQEVEWKFPFDSETYDEFVTRLERLLADESSSPSESNWKDLDESLMK